MTREELLVKALEDIKRATLEGRVCDDVAWFDSITTLHDFCEIILDQISVPLTPPDPEWLRRKSETDPDIDCEARPATDSRRLAETIRTKLLGVVPEDQDVVLEDSDWHMILAALASTPERTPDTTHYLNAIRVRLETLYASAEDNPRLREQLSDEVDWIDAQLNPALTSTDGRGK
jgi:hypothetical protein